MHGSPCSKNSELRFLPSLIDGLRSACGVEGRLNAQVDRYSTQARASCQAEIICQNSFDGAGLTQHSTASGFVPHRDRLRFFVKGLSDENPHPRRR